VAELAKAPSHGDVEAREVAAGVASIPDAIHGN
jgi:hypothetical protein